MEDSVGAPCAYDVFLSHNSKDKPRVRQLAGRLRAQGLRVWFDGCEMMLAGQLPGVAATPTARQRRMQCDRA
jgi:hypothetical protein